MTTISNIFEQIKKLDAVKKATKFSFYSNLSNIYEISSLKMKIEFPSFQLIPFDAKKRNISFSKYKDVKLTVQSFGRK